MKKIALSAALSLAASAAIAGGYDQPVMEAPVIVEETSSSAAGVIVPLMVLLVIAAAAD